jgi:HPt (histidine-containing phosphotransfer) domain-containing protein
MYRYINTDSKYIRELQEFNPEMVVEIAAMFPDEYNKYMALIEDGVAATDVEMILRGVHSLKSNLKIFIDEQHEIIQNIVQIEAQLRSKLEDYEEPHAVVDSIDYKEIPHQLEQRLREPMKEIAYFATHPQSQQ